jgi:hypothetical protein
VSDQINKLYAQNSDPNLMQVKGEISQIMVMAVEAIKNLTRMVVQLKVNEPEEDVCLIDVGIAGWNLFDLLGVLDHFAVNESKGLILKKAG